MDESDRFASIYKSGKLPIAVGMVGLVLIIGGVVSSNILEKTFNKPESYPKDSIIDSRDFQIDVSGAVINPGVYSLPLESIYQDAINLAGGISDDADVSYISKHINLAQKISNNSKIYIPKVSENLQSQYMVGKSISINQASQSELEKITGIGPVTAKKIINNRPYGSIDELVAKKVITNNLLQKIKTEISL